MNDALLLTLNLGSSTLKAACFGGLRAHRAQPLGRVGLDLGAADGPDALLTRAAAALGLPRAPAWVAHRIVHGGDATRPRPLDEEELARLHALAPLAPIHQPGALALVGRACALWPAARQFGVYDTAWHATLPEAVRRLPVPEAWHALGVRRYGFHGLAFAAAMRALRALAADAAQARVVLAHLGGGSSLCAVAAGRSVDTTMGMTPLDGLPMSTRSGSLDPGALLFLMRRHAMREDALEHALYRDSGLRGLSGSSGDVRELLRSPQPAARLALDVFARRVAQGIAAMGTSLGGIDHLVFSGGIGARSAAVRAMIAARLAWLGIGLDAQANAGGAARLNHAGAPVAVWQVEVDEQAEMATECAAAAADGTLALD